MIDIFIVTKLSEGLFFNCIKSIAEKTSDSIKQLIRLNICYTGEDNWQMDTITEKCAELHLPCRVWAQEYNFSKCNNMMVKQTDSEYLLFMNDDVELIDDCISHCYEVCKTKKFGTVGCKLLYADGTIQHAGQMILVSEKGDFKAITHYLLKQPNKQLNDYISIGNTGAFMMLERSKFTIFNEKYASCFEDVEVNLNLIANGFMNVTCGSVEAYHRESKTRKDDDVYIKQNDYQLMQNVYKQNQVKIFSQKGMLERTLVVR